ncbi:hypothetical protein [Arthrobacter oryzae]|uniref:hypothetical protein n=1 Tax=Arthrobacter oryzae TaxID=409290 RepID=UPI002863D67B|nr:hypothetical protein [Arthrobacter oryzae]MDR6508062.1 hypothetical protein [Arthrobacter oryzae]
MNDAISRPLILAMGLAFPAAHILLGIANLHRVVAIWPTIAAMGICLALMVLTTWPAKDRGMPRRHAVLAVTGVLLMDLLVQITLPTAVHPGYAAWHCGAIQMLMVTVAIRKQLEAAWVGICLFAIIDLSGSMMHGLTLVDGLAMVLTPILWVAISHAVSKVFTRCDVQIRANEAHERASAARLAKEHASWISHNEWVTELERKAKPLLTKIATDAMEDPDRTSCLLLQDELRDQVRGRALATATVLRSARAARARGVVVEICDDRETDLPPAVLLEAATQLISVLDRAAGGFITARALPAGNEVAVTILASDDSLPDQEFYVEIRETLDLLYPSNR